MGLRSYLAGKLTRWLNKETPPPDFPMEDFEQLSFEVRPCDILLIKGRTRVSEVIKTITQSAWSHASIYVGRLHDIEQPPLRDWVRNHYQGPEDRQLIIEGLLGRGTVVSELDSYKHDHIRICRPTSLSRSDAQNIIAFLIEHLGDDYDLRQLLDLARFLLPWAVLPRRWRSSLFSKNVGDSTRAVCSSIIAEGFHRVKYPVLPVFDHDENMKVRLIKRNPRLFTPSDFDISPYFDIIKSPFYGESGRGSYRDLPWAEDHIVSPDGTAIINMETNTENKS
ncbi:MAG: hypothetical protein DRQ47_01165 [Gammaproteobacteria bacterium]|nr:MAG: hypothetical protein DRQ47_01165 [Gammaproteobacteria bacterium]